MRATQFEGFTICKALTVVRTKDSHDEDLYEVWEASSYGKRLLGLNAAELMQFCVAFSDECAALMKEKKQ